MKAAWRGVAWRGVAWRGVAWRGVARPQTPGRRVERRGAAWSGSLYHSVRDQGGRTDAAARKRPARTPTTNAISPAAVPEWLLNDALAEEVRCGPGQHITPTDFKRWQPCVPKPRYCIFEPVVDGVLNRRRTSTNPPQPDKSIVQQSPAEPLRSV